MTSLLTNQTRRGINNAAVKLERNGSLLIKFNFSADLAGRERTAVGKIRTSVCMYIYTNALSLLQSCLRSPRFPNLNAAGPVIVL